jgi:O-antigen/teichoic acid export membrane protein
VMALSLPLGALVTPATIMLERSLAYRTLARVEVLQAVAYYGFAVAAVSLGLGVWGLASAAVVRQASSVFLLFRVRPDLFVRPGFSLSRLRPMLRFGLHFQANSFVTMLRDQGLNVGVALIAGTATLGIWTLARRLLELPFLLFQTLWRVSFPATSQLISAGADARSLIERGAKATSIGSGLVLASVAAAAPGLVPAVFGPRWHEAGTIVPIACGALVVAGPVSVATAGYLYASGDAAGVLVATVVHSAIWLGVSLGLLPLIGPVALPVGLVVGSSADAILLARATQRRLAVPLFRPVLWPSVAAFAAGAAGIGFTVLAGTSLTGGVASALIALVLYCVLVLVLEGGPTRELAKVTLSSLRSATRAAPVVQDA